MFDFAVKRTTRRSVGGLQPSRPASPATTPSAAEAAGRVATPARQLADEFGALDLDAWNIASSTRLRPPGAPPLRRSRQAVLDIVAASSSRGGRDLCLTCSQMAAHYEKAATWVHD
ncbi:hypothetical protein GCM10010349_64410 [Streptomyces flavofungini]|nr:hypothetical protein GCM10010349_64410 [Streptomyces flavofungini]